MIFFAHQVAPEETEDGEEAKIAVVWDFDHASGMTAAAYAVRPEEKPADGLVIMPRFVFGKVNCNLGFLIWMMSLFPRVMKPKQSPNVYKIWT